MKIIKKKVIIILLLILVCFNNIKTMDYGNQNKNPNLQSNDQISVYVKKSGRFTVKTIYNIQDIENNNQENIQNNNPEDNHEDIIEKTEEYLKNFEYNQLFVTIKSAQEEEKEEEKTISPLDKSFSSKNNNIKKNILNVKKKENILSIIKEENEDSNSNNY